MRIVANSGIYSTEHRQGAPCREASVLIYVKSEDSCRPRIKLSSHVSERLPESALQAIGNTAGADSTPSSRCSTRSKSHSSDRQKRENRKRTVCIPVVKCCCCCCGEASARYFLIRVANRASSIRDNSSTCCRYAERCQRGAIETDNASLW